MIDVAVTFLANETNRHLARVTASEGDLLISPIEVKPGLIVDDSGKWFDDANICLALINIEEERALKSQIPDRALVNGTYVVRQPEIKLNLQLLFAVRPGKSIPYETGLRSLSHILTFFQMHPTFKSDEYPSLNPEIERLNVELLSYGPEQLNQMWTYLGAKYLPSAVYKVRMIVLQGMEPQGMERPISSIETAVQAT
jgi:hypothetical protein